jgi:hypothetical protein
MRRGEVRRRPPLRSRRVSEAAFEAIFRVRELPHFRMITPAGPKVDVCRILRARSPRASSGLSNRHARPAESAAPDSATESGGKAPNRPHEAKRGSPACAALPRSGPAYLLLKLGGTAPLVDRRELMVGGAFVIQHDQTVRIGFGVGIDSVNDPARGNLPTQ